MWFVKSIILAACVFMVWTDPIQLPSFPKLKENYPGFRHHGGHFNNNRLIKLIGCSKEMLLHDTSALRLSFTFNKIGGQHSLGKNPIHLSKYGKDSIPGEDNLQYIFHPIAYGPYMADKYGYPNVSRLHEVDPINTKKHFWGRQGILRVITYTKLENRPKGHVALWDCNHFHQTRDWITHHSLITVEFWESPDSDCTDMDPKSDYYKQLLVPMTRFGHRHDLLPKTWTAKDLKALHIRRKVLKRGRFKKSYINNTV